MIKAILTDLYKVIVFPKENHDDYDPLSMNFLDCFTINYAYLELITSYGVPVDVFSNATHQLQDMDLQQALHKYIRNIYSSPQLGLDKASIYAYEFMAKNKLGLKPEVVVYIDDSSKNTSAAAKAGMVAYDYLGLDDIKNKCDNIFDKKA